MENAKKPFYRYCLVPMCKNTIRSTPDKLFFHIPKYANIRNEWCKAMRRDTVLSSSSTLYCCEDHFNLEEDTENFTRYTLMGCRLHLKKHVLPHKFACQSTKRPQKRPAVAQRRRKCVKKKIPSEFIECVPDDEEIKQNEEQSVTIECLDVDSDANTKIETQVEESNTSQQSKKKTEPKKQYDPFQEYANDSTDEESNESTITDNGSDRGAPVTEKVFVTCNSYEGEKSRTGPTQAKRARLETSEIKIDYTEELYEFGKFVAEQLMCLDVEDARIAQAEIRDVLSKFDMSNLMQCKEEPTSPDIQPEIEEHSTVVTHKKIQVKPFVNPGSSTSQSGSKVNIACKSGAQSKKIAEPSITKLDSQVTIAGPSGTQSGLIGSSLTEFVVLHVNRDAASTAPIGYVVAPTTTQLASKEGTPVTLSRAGTSGSAVESGSSNVISAGSSVAQPGSSNLYSPGASVAQPGSSNVCFAGTSVKIEPEPESSHDTHSHVNVFMPRETETNSFVVKLEPNDSDVET